MKELIDIHTLLSTPSDMEDIHAEAEKASDNLNAILHMVYDRLDDEMDVTQIENILSHVWEHWHQDQYLGDIDTEDSVEWVDYLMNTWDNPE